MDEVNFNSHFKNIYITNGSIYYTPNTLFRIEITFFLYDKYNILVSRIIKKSRRKFYYSHKVSPREI